MPIDLEALWDVQDVSDRLRVKPATLYSWVQLGYIPYVKLGNCVRFRPTDVAAWVNGHVRPGRMTREPALMDTQHDACTAGVMRA
jgi:excisionase family DNA binding protein